MIKINRKLQTSNCKFQTFILRNFVFFILIFAFCFVKDAHAHKVYIYAYAEDGVIYSESYFVDGTRCKNSKIEVFDEKAGNKLIEGKTDENGEFSFKIPKVTSLRLVLHASMGHQSEFTLSEDELREAMGEKQPPMSLSATSPLKSGNSVVKETVVVSKLKGISKSEIETIVEDVIDKKLQPAMRILLNLQEKSEKPGLTEILGGIGYIIGILGIIAYFKRKSKSRHNRS